MKQLPTLQRNFGLNALQWVLNPTGYLEDKQARYPDIFIAKGIGFGDTIVLTSHPEAIQTILTSDRRELSAPGYLNRILSPLIGDYSVIMLEGKRHQKRRQLVMPSFHGDRMKNYGDLIVKITHEAMQKLPPGKVWPARSVTQSISLEVIIQTVFGLNQGERYTKLKQLLTQIGERFSSPMTSTLLFFPKLQQDWGSWSPWGHFLRRRDAIDSLLYAEIAERRAHPQNDRVDILSLLLAAEDENGEKLSDQELRDELMTLLFAGHETTATAMAWALYWIHRLPEVKEKLDAEMTDLGKNPHPLDLFKAPYLTAICQETLRIHPVAMLTFPRLVEKPLELLNYKLTPGMVVMGCIYLTHQREDIYPNHTAFQPERFLNKQFSPYEFLPFGGGVRRCLGEALAQYEMRLVVGTIAANYSLELADTQPEKPRRRGVTLAPGKGVQMSLRL